MFSVMSLGNRGRLYFSWIIVGSRNRTDQLPLRDSIMIPGPMSLSDCGDGILNPSTRLGGDLRAALPTALPNVGSLPIEAPHVCRRIVLCA